MAPLRRAWIWTLPLLAWALVGGGLAPLAAAPSLKGVRWRAIGQPATEGVLVSLDATGARFEGRAAPVPLEDLVELRFSAPGPEPTDAGAPPEAIALRVVLRGGESLRGRFLSGDDAGLVLRPLGGSDLRVPFDVLRRIELEGPTRGPCDEPGRQRPPRKGADVAWATSGDAFAGTLVGADASGLTLEDAGEERTLPWKDLVVVHVDEAPLPPPEGLLAEAETVGGSLWPGSVRAYGEAGLSLTTRSGLEVVLPREALVALRFSGGRFVYASDLPFTSKFTSYYGDDALDPTWLERWYGARADRTPSGCPLRIAGVGYRHGIAVHARSSVTLPLRKGFAQFSTHFGIDDEALAAPQGPHGDVTARILADGKELWSSAGSVKGGEPARVVGPLDVTGVDDLVLEVDFGGGENRMDRADWAEPILVRP